MGRVVRALTVDRLDDLVSPCRACRFWELTPVQARWAGGPGSPLRDPKRGWLTSVLLEWGTPGRVVYVDDTPAGYLTYAPAPLVPRAVAFPTTPVSVDAVLLITARVSPQYAGQGLGRVLIQSAAKDLLRRRLRAIEVFAATNHSGDSTGGSTADRGGDHQDAAGGGGCLLPVDFLTAVGFHTVRDHATFPRLRLDLRTALRWRVEVEHAVERLFTPLRGLGVPPPVGTANRE